MIDTIHAVQTPEGVDLSLRVAGPVPRALAWGVDLVLQIFGGGAAASVLVSLLGGSGFGVGLALIALFLVSWFYPVAFEVLAHGQTPGKRFLGLRVVQENGTPVGWSASVLRNFLLVADFLPLLYLAGLTSMCLDPSFRRLGDLAAGTLVVHTDSQPRLWRSRRPEPSLAPAEPPPLPLTLEEQGAVIAFAERASLLSPERALELAAIPASVSGSGEAARTRLLGYAAFLLGRDA
jgi:uncharacterized RDD family membrane protein YckC